VRGVPSALSQLGKITTPKQFSNTKSLASQCVDSIGPVLTYQYEKLFSYHVLKFKNNLKLKKSFLRHVRKATFSFFSIKPGNLYIMHHVFPKLQIRYSYCPVILNFQGLDP